MADRSESAGEIDLYDVVTWSPRTWVDRVSVRIYGLLALGLNLHYGYTGLLNFGHVAFFAAGAFASALVTLPPPGSQAYLELGGSYQIGFGLPFPVGLVLAGLAGGLLALLVGVTSIRLSGHYLAIATFALAEIFRSFLSNEEWLTRGEYGISVVSQPLKGSLVSVPVYPYFYLLLTAIVVAIGYWLTTLVTESPFGRVLRGIREDELAARSLGKATPRVKLKAFVLGGVLAGVAGSLWTHSIGAVHVGQFVPIVTFLVWLAVLLGGAGNNFGVLVGAFILIAIRESTRFLDSVPLLSDYVADLAALRFVLIGLLLIVVVRFFPNGVVPERRRKAAAPSGEREEVPA